MRTAYYIHESVLMKLIFAVLYVFACGWESVVDDKRPGRWVVLTTDAAVAAVTFLAYGLAISVRINVGDMLKNKMLIFDI